MLSPHSQVTQTRHYPIKIVTFITRFDSTIAAVENCFFFSFFECGYGWEHSWIDTWAIGRYSASVDTLKDGEKKKKKKRKKVRPSSTTFFFFSVCESCANEWGRRRRLMKKKKKKKSDVTRKRQKANDPATPTTTIQYTGTPDTPWRRRRLRKNLYLLSSSSPSWLEDEKKKRVTGDYLNATGNP